MAIKKGTKKSAPKKSVVKSKKVGVATTKKSVKASDKKSIVKKTVSPQKTIIKKGVSKQSVVKKMLTSFKTVTPTKTKKAITKIESPKKITKKNITDTITTAPQIASKKVVQKVTYPFYIDVIIRAIQDKKGEKITLINVSQLKELVTYHFIICEATTQIQLRAIADHIEEKLKEELGERVFKRDLEKISEWMVLDYFNFIIHLFLPEQRQFYNIEDNWSDGIITHFL